MFFLRSNKSTNRGKKHTRSNLESKHSPAKERQFKEKSRAIIVISKSGKQNYPRDMVQNSIISIINDKKYSGYRPVVIYDIMTVADWRKVITKAKHPPKVTILLIEYEETESRYYGRVCQLKNRRKLYDLVDGLSGRTKIGPELWPLLEDGDFA